MPKWVQHLLFIVVPLIAVFAVAPAAYQNKLLLFNFVIFLTLAQGVNVIYGFTANAQPDEVENCRRAGMDDCLFKPIGLDNLRLRLEAVPKISTPDTPPVVEQQTEGFDLRSLKEMTGGNPGLIRRLLEELYSSNQVDIDQVQPLWAAGDWKQLGDLAHRMKGAARLVNADALQELCGKLEGGCKDGLDSQEVLTRALAVEKAMASLQDDLLHQLRKLAA